MWTNDYKKHLCLLLSQNIIKSFTEKHTSTSVCFEVVAAEDWIDDIMQRGDTERDSGKTSKRKKASSASSSASSLTRTMNNGEQELLQEFKLWKSISAANMHAFDHTGNMKKYLTATDVLEEHFQVRFRAYEQRKAALLVEYGKEREWNTNKSRFVDAILHGHISLLGGGKNSDMSGGGGGGEGEDVELVSQLKMMNFFSDSDFLSFSSSSLTCVDNNNTINKDKQTFRYLLDMPISSFTPSRSLSLKKAVEDNVQKHLLLTKTGEEELWRRDLLLLRQKLMEEK